MFLPLQEPLIFFEKWQCANVLVVIANFDISCQNSNLLGRSLLSRDVSKKGCDWLHKIQD